MLTGNFQAPEGMSPIYKPPVLSEGDASAYYANPFRMQEQIVQQNQAAQQAALLDQLAQRGMLTSYDGSEATSAPLSPQTIAFLESETDRDSRMSKISDIIGYLTPFGQLSLLSGLFTQDPAPVVDMSSPSSSIDATGYDWGGVGTSEGWG
jgi:hypothetical protein